MSGTKQSTSSLRREYTMHSGCERKYVIGGHWIDATPDLDTLDLMIRTDAWDAARGRPGEEHYPACPDCGGQIVWAEAGRVPGSRQCSSCGSTFADTRYSCAWIDWDCQTMPVPWIIGAEAELWRTLAPDAAMQLIDHNRKMWLILLEHAT